MADVWPQVELNSLFRIGREQVLPSAQPDATYVHYSIPAWDERAGPVHEVGRAIESNKTAVNTPSVLVSKLNPRKPRVVPIESVAPNTCCSTEFICYQPRRDQECLPFWAAYFSSGAFARRLEQVAVGSTNSHTRANPSETLRWLVPNPSSAEKLEITSILHALDAAIRRTEAIIEKLKQVKQGLLHDLLTRGIDENGELRPPQSEAPHLYKQSPLGWIPKEWSYGQVKHAGSVQLGRQRSPEHQRGSHLVPYLRVANVFDGYFDFSDVLRMNFSPREQEIYSVSPGDILLNEGQSLELVGRCALYDCEAGRFCFQNTLVRFRSNASVLSAYMRSLFKYWLDTARFTQVAKQTTSIAHLGADRFAEMSLALPKREEQEHIVEKISSIEVRSSQDERLKTKLELVRRGLLDDLLTGRVRVTTLLKE